MWGCKIWKVETEKPVAVFIRSFYIKKVSRMIDEFRNVLMPEIAPLID